MKTKQILTAGAIALSMILTGCSSTSTDTKDTKTTEVAKKKEVKTIGQKTKDSKTSESKKDNTASTTNTSSNKNNSSSSSSKPSSKPSNSSSNNTGTSKPSNNSGSNSSNSKPAEHTHNWVAQYQTVNVPEKGHNEQVLVQAAYDEQVPITEMKAFDICSTCGAELTSATASAHVKNHMINGEDKGGWHTEWREVVTGYNTVHHDAVYETRYVVDSPATTKQELTGYKCSSCGKTKAN